MSVQDITRRALARGVDAQQWTRLVAKSVSSNTDVNTSTKLCKTLVRPLLSSRVPLSLLLQYISAGISASIISPSAVVQQLLALIYVIPQEQTGEDQDALGRNVDAVCKIILEKDDARWIVLSPQLMIESLDNSKVETISTASALVKTLRLGTSTRPNFVAFVIRLLDNLPLSSSKSNTHRSGIEELRSLSENPEKVMDLHPDIKISLKRFRHNGGGRSTGQPVQKTEQMPLQEDMMNIDVGLRQSPDPLKPDEFNEGLVVGVPSYICVAIKSAITTSWVTTPTTSSSIPEIYKSLILLGPSLTTRSTSFLHYLILASLELVLSAEAVEAEGDEDFVVGKGRRGVKELVWGVDGVWMVLAWWKGKEDGNWMYPATFLHSLRMILPMLNDRILEFDTRMLSRHNRLAGDVSMGGNSGMDVDFGFDFNAFGSGDAGVTPPPQPLLNLIAQSLLRYDLIDQEGLQELSLTPPPSDEEVVSLSSMLAAEPEQADAMALRALMSPNVYQSLAMEILQAFDSFANIPDTLIEYLSEHIAILDLVAEQQPPARILDRLNRCLDFSINGTGGGSDDPQALLAKCGSLILLTELVCFEYSLPVPDSLSRASNIFLLENLRPAEQQCLAGWIKALFGSSGIDDEILQATTPATLSKLAPTLVSQACLAAQDDIISLDILRGGLSYFSQPLLSWCVGGVLDWLCVEIPRQGSQAMFHLDVLSVLLMGGGLPASVLHVHADAIEEIIQGKNGLDQSLEEANIDVAALQAKLDEGKRSRKRITVRATSTAGWPETARTAVRELLQSEGFAAPAFAAVDIINCAITRTSLPTLSNAVLHELMGVESNATTKLTTALQLLYGLSMSQSMGYSLVLSIPQLLQTSQFSDDKGLVNLAHMASVILRGGGKVQDRPDLTPSSPITSLALQLYVDMRTRLEMKTTKRRSSTLTAFASALAKNHELVGDCPFFARIA